MPSVYLPKIRLNDKDYTVGQDQNGNLRPIQINVINPFPSVQATQAQAGVEQYGLNQRVQLTGPLGTGQRVGNDLRRGFDQYNIIAWYPGFVTRGPQQQTPTWTGGPATAKIAPGTRGFFRSTVSNRLFMLVQGATTEEPLWYLSGTTWTDGTLNADVTSDPFDIVGMTQIGATLYVIHRTAQLVGADLTHVYSSADGTTWARDLNGGTAENEATVHGLHAAYRAASNAYVLLTIENTPRLRWRTPGGASAWATVGGTLQMTAGATYLNFRGFADWLDDAGNPIVVFMTNSTIYYTDMPTASSPQVYELYEIENNDGSYSGHPIAGADGNLYYLDGPNLCRLRWVSGAIQRDILGPENVSDSRIRWDGVPLEATGDCTAIDASRQLPAIYVAKGGLAASRNARIWRYDLSTGLWNCPYRHATAQRAITALVEHNDILHHVIEQAAGGDQDPFYFNNITQNPLSNSSYEYTSAEGRFEDSERDMGLSGLVNKIYLTTQLDADSLSANETVGFQHATNGGSFDTAQTITSSTSPSRVYVDGASTATGTKAKRLQVRWLFNGTAGATAGPTVKSVSYVYTVASEKPAGGPVFEFLIPLEFKKDDYRSLTGLSQVVSDLNTLVAGTLVNLVIGQTTYKVKVEGYQRDATPQPVGVTADTQPEPEGQIILICRERAE